MLAARQDEGVFAAVGSDVAFACADELSVGDAYLGLPYDFLEGGYGQIRRLLYHLYLKVGLGLPCYGVLIRDIYDLYAFALYEPFPGAGKLGYVVHADSGAGLELFEPRFDELRGVSEVYAVVGEPGEPFAVEVHARGGDYEPGPLAGLHEDEVPSGDELVVCNVLGCDLICLLRR